MRSNVRMRPEAFERLYDEHAASILRFLIYRTGDTALAEDLAADTFERVLRAGRRFDPRRGSQKTWVYAIALNVLRDHHRRASAEQRAFERTGAPDDFGAALESETVETRAALARALSRLGADEREAVALRYGADLTIPQIAKVTGEKPATIEKRLYRALGKLRKELAPDYALG
jgi:RNA polymerase sigma-70 factor (ECF subfamily)